MDYTYEMTLEWCENLWSVWIWSVVTYLTIAINFLNYQHKKRNLFPKIVYWQLHFVCFSFFFHSNTFSAFTLLQQLNNNKPKNKNHCSAELLSLMFVFHLRTNISLQIYWFTICVVFFFIFFQILFAFFSFYVCLKYEPSNTENLFKFVCRWLVKSAKIFVFFFFFKLQLFNSLYFFDWYSHWLCVPKVVLNARLFFKYFFFHFVIVISC